MPIETLESRIAPANLINPHTVSYVDSDGDHVLVTTTKGSFDLLQNFVFAPSGAGEQLQRLELAGMTEFQGAAIKIVSSPGGGDGFINVGFVNATGIDLAGVVVDGDLGRILVGDTIVKTPALALLKVRSMGGVGTTTQEPGGNLGSTVTGGLGAFQVAHDFISETFFVTGGPSGRIGSVTIGGSMIGVGLNSGSIFTTGSIGPVKIGGFVVGGAAGVNSARIDSGDSIASVQVALGLFGGADGSGVIQAERNLGPVFIGGSVIGGPGNGSGLIETEQGGNIAAVTIKGFLVGGAGQDSGKIQTDRGGKIGPVIIGTAGGAGGIQGAAGSESGAIVADDGGSIAGVTVHGSVVGAGGDGSGSIQVINAGNIGPVLITGNLQGLGGDNSGAILIGDNGSIASVTIIGSLLGSAGDNSGSIQTNDVGNVGPVKIGNAIVGGSGSQAGSIQAPKGSIASVTIGSNIVGSAGADSGSIVAWKDVGPVKIAGAGNLIGSAGTESGSIISRNGDIVSVVMNGSLVGGSGTVFDSGTIQAELGAIRMVAIKGDLIGGSTAAANIADTTGAILGQSIGTVVIGGSITAGTNGGILLIDSGVIRAGHQFKSLTVMEDVVGNISNNVTITALGQLLHGPTSDVAIGSVKIGGDAAFMTILAGYTQSGAAANPDAQIGSVRVTGNLTASSIAAGVISGDGFFGTVGDASIPAPGLDNPGIISRIGSIIVGGAIGGTLAPGDTYGFVAEEVGVVRYGGTLLAHTPGARNDLAPVSVPLMTADVKLLEVL